MKPPVNPFTRERISELLKLNRGFQSLCPPDNHYNEWTKHEWSINSNGITPEERAYIKSRWEAMPGDRSYTDAWFDIVQEYFPPGKI